VIGRRQIGKSSLIDEFIRNKEHFKIEFADTSLDTNLGIMSRSMTAASGKTVRYSTSLDFFWDLADLIKGHKMIVVFDEFPYMLECDMEFAALTQHFVDTLIGDSKLILSGSSVRTMEYETTDHSRPLYGRSQPMYITEMPLRECMSFHPEMDDI